jgi:hypothetical protein
MSRSLLFVALAAATAVSGVPIGPMAYADPVAQKPSCHLQESQGWTLSARDGLKKTLAKARARHLAALRAYLKKGVFAHSLDRAGEVYVWKDAENHLDLVPALMASDGKGNASLADGVAPKMNGIRLTDVRCNGIHDWTLVSGFSQDEIDRLQPPHTRPTVLRDGDDSWRAAEDERMAKAYSAAESYLSSHTDEGLERATDELMSDGGPVFRLVDLRHQRVRELPN